MKKFILSLAIITIVSSLGAIGNIKAVEADTVERTATLKEERFDFNGPDYSNFYISDGWSNGSLFNCIWRRDNVAYRDGKMFLTIDKDKIGDKKPYSGGEIGTTKKYSYGYYSVKMKPISNSGVVSSFFTYATNSNGGAHEIDIEFTGKDTTKVEFNYFVDGQTSGGFVHELGFDASKELHEYGFLWLEDSITWYVDGKAVVTTKGERTGGKLPNIPATLLMNVWPGNSPGWLGPYDGKTPLTAEYDYAIYRSKELFTYDIDKNGQVDINDLAELASYYNKTSNDAAYRDFLDFNKDGIVDLYDMTGISKYL